MSYDITKNLVLRSSYLVTILERKITEKLNTYFYSDRQ